MDTPTEVEAPKRPGLQPGMVPWQPGKSGNPNGRPKDTIGPLARKMGPKAIAVLYEIMTTSRSHSDRIKAAQVILDRGFGKAREAIEITGNTALLMAAVDAPPAESREAWIARKQAELIQAQAVLAIETAIDAQVVDKTENTLPDKDTYEAIPATEEVKSNISELKASDKPQAGIEPEGDL